MKRQIVRNSRTLYSLNNWHYVKSAPVECTSRESELQSTILQSLRALCQTDEVWQLVRYSVERCIVPQFLESVFFPFAGRYFLNNLGIERYIVKQNILSMSSDLHRCLLPEIVSLICDCMRDITHVMIRTTEIANNHFYFSLLKYANRLYFNEQHYMVLTK